MGQKGRLKKDETRYFMNKKKSEPGTEGPEENKTGFMCLRRQTDDKMILGDILGPKGLKKTLELDSGHRVTDRK